MKRTDEHGRVYDETGALWIDDVRAFVDGKVTSDYLTYLRLRITHFDNRTKWLDEQIEKLSWGLANPEKTSVPVDEIASALVQKQDHMRLVQSLRWSFIRRLEFCTLECSDRVISA